MDTVAYVTQPLDILGKRSRRIEVAEEGIGRTQAEYDLARVQLINSVKLTYWTARGAQETRDVLQASVVNFQRTVDYHAARLSAGGWTVPQPDANAAMASSASANPRRARNVGAVIGADYRLPAFAMRNATSEVLVCSYRYKRATRPFEIDSRVC